MSSALAPRTLLQGVILLRCGGKCSLLVVYTLTKLRVPLPQLTLTCQTTHTHTVTQTKQWWNRGMGAGGGGGGEGKGLRGWRATSPNFPKMVDNAATKGRLVCYYFGMWLAIADNLLHLCMLSVIKKIGRKERKALYRHLFTFLCYQEACSRLFNSLWRDT